MVTVILRYGALLAVFLLLLEFLRRSAFLFLWPGGVYPAIVAGLFLAVGGVCAWLLANRLNVRKRAVTLKPDAEQMAEIGLTEREADVMIYLAHGFTNKEIATQLKVAPSTIKTHVKNILMKLGVTNRTEAASEARALGLVK